MSPVENAVIRRHLFSGPPPIVLEQDLVLCYPGQSPTAAVWLVEGILECTSKRATRTTMTPGLYLIHELAEGTPIHSEVRVRAGSRVWPLTRTDVKLAHA